MRGTGRKQGAQSAPANFSEVKDRLQRDDTTGALAILAPLISAETDNLPARFLLGMTAWKMGRLDWAVTLLRECHERWPMDGIVAETLASLYAQAGDLHESLFMGKLATALKDQRQLAALVLPEFPSFGATFQNIQAQPKLEAAELCLSAGDLAGALENARQHAALKPQDMIARAYYSALLLQAGKASLAVETLKGIERAADFAPGHASLYARALTAVGAFDPARHWHSEAVALASEEADIVAAQLSDGLWLENASSLKAASAAWVRQFCSSAKPPQWRPIDRQLTIGYIVSASADPLDVLAIAAVARAHNRNHVKVIGYGVGPQSWKANLPFQGAFDVWQDIGALDPDTLGLYLDREELHVIVDTAGLASPANLQALSQLNATIRVAWLGNTAAIAQPVYDAKIVPVGGKAEGLMAWQIGGGYPVLHRAKELRLSDAGRKLQFGADVVMAQIDGETVRLWSDVMRQHPDAKLLLRAHDMGPGANIDRLVALFERELAARIDIVDDQDANDFYARIDVALTPCKGVSPRMAADALACGVVPVAVGGTGIGRVYRTFLEGIGLGSALVASAPQDFAKLVNRLSMSIDARKEVISTLSRSQWAGEEGVTRFAYALEDLARRALDPTKALAS